MPKIRINEHDMTGVIQKSPISNIIYIYNYILNLLLWKYKVIMVFIGNFHCIFNLNIKKALKT